MGGYLHSEGPCTPWALGAWKGEFISRRLKDFLDDLQERDQYDRNGNSGKWNFVTEKAFWGREGGGGEEFSEQRGEGGREETHQACKFIVIFIFISGIFKICTGILAAA